MKKSYLLFLIFLLGGCTLPSERYYPPALEEPAANLYLAPGLITTHPGSVGPTSTYFYENAKTCTGKKTMAIQPYKPIRLPVNQLVTLTTITYLENAYNNCSPLTISFYPEAGWDYILSYAYTDYKYDACTVLLAKGHGNPLNSTNYRKIAVIPRNYVDMGFLSGRPVGCYDSVSSPVYAPARLITPVIHNPEPIIQTPSNR